MVNLKELLLQKEDKIDKKMTNVESNYKEDKSEENDNMKILKACLQGSKRAGVE